MDILYQYGMRIIIISNTRENKYCIDIFINMLEKIHVHNLHFDFQIVKVTQKKVKTYASF